MLSRFDKEKITLIIIFAALTIIQLIVANQLRFVPTLDAGSLFFAAIDFATTGSITNLYYFAMFGNQWAPLLFISGIFRITRFFTQDFFMVYAGVLAVIVNMGLFAMYDLIKRQSSRRVAFIMLGVVLIYTPIYVFPTLIYTDVASMAMPILALNLFYRIKDSACKKKRVVLAILLGVTLAVGTAIKITVLIIFIAMVMLAWIFNERAALYKALLIAALIIVAVMGVSRIHYRHHISDELLERWQTPWYQWIIMGLKEEGLEDNMWTGTNVGHFYNATFHMETMEERKAFLREEFIRLTSDRNAVDWARLFVKKYIVLHYRGDFAPGATIAFTPEDTGFMAWYRDVRFTTPYIVYHRIIIYTITLLAYISVFFKRRDHVAALALLGVYMFFIFLCEVRVRLLTNQFYIFFYLASISVNGIILKIQQLRSQKNEALVPPGIAPHDITPPDITPSDVDPPDS